MENIATLMDKLTPLEGLNTTYLPGTGVYRATQFRGREPLCYNQGIIVVGQGSKRVFLGNSIYEYNPENYLVLSVPIPAECETYASREEPLLALLVDIDLAMLNRIINQMDEHIGHTLLDNTEKHKGIYVAPTTPEFSNVVQRLLIALQSPLESSVLGRGLIYELLYRVMLGKNGSPLYALAMKNTNLARIDKALKQLHSSYNETMTVDSLAALVNMSSSAFHRAFHDVTSSSPIQYLKKIRLSKARELLLERGVRVSEAATHVGYESAAQFSREYKRHFGVTPSKEKGKVASV